MKKFKVMTFVYESDFKTNLQTRKYELLKDGLSWQDAKVLRGQHKGSMITFDVEKFVPVN